MHWASFASIGAGVIHGAAVGLHADHFALSRIFLALTALQVCWGVLALNRTSKGISFLGLSINGIALGGWVLSKTVGISAVSGLEIVEKPQPADSLCALLAGISIVSIMWAWNKRAHPAGHAVLLNGVYVCGSITLLALWGITGHVHAGGHDVVLTDSGLSINADGVIVSPSTIAPSNVASPSTLIPTTSINVVVTTRKSSSTVPRGTTTIPSTTTTTIHAHTVTRDQTLAAASGWPKPFDPAAPIDFSGIGGVTTEQATRAAVLIKSAARDLPKYATTGAATADGYLSIGDGSSGFEHYIKYSLLNDGRVLDTTAPESLVYSTSNGVKTLVSAMFIANPGTSINDATLVNYAGGLMQWHVHTNLCWMTIGGVPKVVGVTNAAGVCTFGAPQSGGAPMVHVWITPHQCGPFAALEGVGAGVADVSDSERVDLCNKAH